MLPNNFILYSLSFLFLLHFSLCNEDFNPVPKGNGKFNDKYSHSNSDNLYFIYEHFRHGARSPCMRPLNKGKDLLGAPWPGVGDLTNTGKKQHFLLGKKNRERYDGFINKKLDNNEIILFSTNIPRTKMSAQYHLLGFYNQDSYMNFTKINKNKKKQKFFNLSKIIPPIHLLEKNKNTNGSIEYKQTFHTFYNCPNMNKMYKLNLEDKNQKIHNLLKKFNKEYYDIVKKEYNITYITKVFGLYDFCDAIVADYYDKDRIIILDKFEKHGKKMEIVVKFCDEYISERFYGLAESGFSKEHGIVTMSNTMKKMIIYMKNRMKVERNFVDSESPKYVLYSGHVETLIAAQRFLKNAFNIDFEVVPFASNQIFEVRKYGNQFNVEVYYNDRLKLNISFDLFEKKVNEIALSEDDIKNKCFGFESKNSSIYFDKKVLLFGFLLLVLFGVFISTRKRYFKKIGVVDEKPRMIQIV